MISESFIFACFSGLVLILASTWTGYAHYRGKLGMSKPRHGRSIVRVLLGLGLAVIAWATLRFVFSAPVEETGSLAGEAEIAGYIVGLISGILGLAIIFYSMIKARSVLAQELMSAHEKSDFDPNTLDY